MPLFTIRKRGQASGESAPASVVAISESTTNVSVDQHTGSGSRVGGHPALDFINTVHDWTVSEPHDYLSEFADAIRFGKANGLLTRADDLRLRQRTAAELTRLRKLCALLKRIFQMRLSGQAPSNVDLGKLGADLAEAARATCSW